MSQDQLQKELGPYLVNINIGGQEPVISGSVNNLYQSPFVFHDVTAFGSNNLLNGASYGGCLNQVLGQRTNGFTVRRYIPHAPDPVLLNAYYLEQTLINSASTDAFLHRIELLERHTDDLPREVFQKREAHLISASCLQFANGIRNMSVEHVAGAVNPTFIRDETCSNDNKHVTAEAEIQITRFGGRELETDDKGQKRNTYIVSNADGDEKEETVLDILVKNETDKSVQKKQPDEFRITISDHDLTVRDNPPNETTEVTPSDGLTLKRSVKQSKLADSLKKAETPPPLDVNNKSPRVKTYFDTPEWTDEDTKWLAWIEVKFKDIAGEDGEIDLEEFKKALGVKKSFFAERFFELFDQDSSGSIELAELMDGLRMLTKGTPAQKLQFLFDVYDADASGSIDRDELMAVLRACMEESSLSLTDENLEDLTDVLFDAADEDESGTITFEELRGELEKHPGVIENLTIRLQEAVVSV